MLVCWKKNHYNFWMLHSCSDCSNYHNHSCEVWWYRSFPAWALKADSMYNHILSVENIIHIIYKYYLYISYFVYHTISWHYTNILVQVLSVIWRKKYCRCNRDGKRCGLPWIHKSLKLESDDDIFIYRCLYVGVSKNRDTPKWMVYNGKPY